MSKLQNFISAPQPFHLKNGAKAVIREAHSSDAKELLDFINTVSGESDFLSFGTGEFELTEQEEAEFLAKSQAAADQIYLVATVEKRIVGTLHFAAGRRPRVSHSGEFGMSVSKAYWGQGVGSRLLDGLLEWAKETGTIKKINLRVRADNNRAVKLYERKGFVREGTLTNEMCIDGQYFDLYAMGFNL